MISRIAPTPSGYLHAGNAFSFLLTWLLVRLRAGKLVLRIDDSDAERKRPEYLEDIFRTLAWLGIDYDIGPSGPDDFERHWSQNLHEDRYASVLDALAHASGGTVFACRCSRKELAEAASPSSYPGTCLHLGLPLDAENSAWRLCVPGETVLVVNDVLRPKLKVPIGASPGSFVIRRRDKKCAYQVVSLIEDQALGINFIVRGSDLLESSAMQLYVADFLGFRDFQTMRFLHHGLVTGADGRKLSKSTQAAPLALRGFDDRARVDFLDEFLIWMGRKKGECATLSELLAMLAGEDLQNLLGEIPR